jgi:hypothetical protein
MFIVYPIFLAVPIGLLLGGSFTRLGTIQVRWAWLALAGLAVQIVLFSDAVASAVGAAGPALYVGSTLAVFVVVLRNLRVPGFALIALGAGLNLAAILANGGCMPSSTEALAAVGELHDLDPGVYTNSCLPDQVALAPLTDILHLPPEMPLANVFSIGDAVIGVGVAVAIIAGMKRGGGAADSRTSHA